MVGITGFLSGLNPFRSAKHSNAGLASPEQWLIEALLGGLKTKAGIKVTQENALGVATVFACVNKIAQTISCLPFQVYRRLPGGGREPAADHPLYSILHDEPNPEMTSVDFRTAMQSNLTLRRNAIALIVRDGFGRVAELWPVEAIDYQLRRDAATKRLVYTIGGKEYGPESVLHLRTATFNGTVGLDAMTQAREAIALAIALQDNAARFFSNASRPGGFLEFPGVLKDEELKRLRESFEQSYKGTENAYKVAILEHGMKFVASQANNEQAQFNESRIFQAKEIARIFGVPQHKVGILDNATFSNIEHQSIEWVSDTLLPIVTAWESSCNMRLLTKEERATYFVKLNLSGLLRADIKTRFEAYGIGRQWGWLCPDEIRELEDQNPLPDDLGKIYLVPGNMVPAENAKNLGAPKP